MSEKLELDEEQLAAVEASERGVAVLAGPGSGKTHVLSYRARYLLLEDPGSKALLLTFTNKAAAEMKSRAMGVATVASDRIQSQTYHSLCMRFLRAHGSLVGIEPDFEVIDSDEQADLATRVARSAGVHNYRRQWSSQRLRRLLPKPAVAEFGAVYEEEKRRGGVVDFDDLIVYAAELLQQNPEIAAAYGSKYRHLLIDEFQDTNAAQFAVVRALASTSATVSVFADDDQAIFRFAGAEAAHIRRFCDELQAQIYPLTINYRCRAEIVACANRLILSDGTSSGRRMRAHRSGGEVKTPVFRSIEDEASAISGEIQALVSGGVEPVDIAVLVRSGYRSQLLLDRLIAAGLPVSNWLTQSADSSAKRMLRAALSVVRPSLGERAVRDLCQHFGLSDNGERGTELFLASQSDMPAVAGLLRLNRLALEGGAAVGVVRQAAECISATSSRDAEEVAFLVQAMEAFAEHDPQFSVDQVLSELALHGSPGPPTASGGIKVASLHRTKGLQWQHVYLLGLEDGHIPDYRAADEGEEQLREERRLCFVGICRAEDCLTLTRVRTFRGFARSPSPYQPVEEVPSSIGPTPRGTRSARSGRRSMCGGGRQRRRRVLGGSLGGVK